MRVGRDELAGLAGWAGEAGGCCASLALLSPTCSSRKLLTFIPSSRGRTD